MFIQLLTLIEIIKKVRMYQRDVDRKNDVKVNTYILCLSIFLDVLYKKENNNSYLY